MTTATILSLSSSPSLSLALCSVSKPNPNCFFSLLPSITSSSPLLISPSSTVIGINHRNPQGIRPNSTRTWRSSAFLGPSILLSEVENSQQMVPADNEGGSYVVSALLLVAFVGLSVLTAGVIYIGVTDFLQKREKEKFEKEETAKEKKKGKKGVVKARARAGPRGFGQKINDDNDDDDD